MWLNGMDRSMLEREMLTQTLPAAHSEPLAHSLLAQQLNLQLPPGTSPRNALTSLPPTQPGLAGADTTVAGCKTAPCRAPAYSSVQGLPQSHAGTP